MEDVEEPAADGGGHDVVLLAAGAGADPSQRQEHRQGRTHAKEVFHLKDKGGKKILTFPKGSNWHQGWRNNRA